MHLGSISTYEDSSRLPLKTLPLGKEFKPKWSSNVPSFAHDLPGGKCETAIAYCSFADWTHTIHTSSTHYYSLS